MDHPIFFYPLHSSFFFWPLNTPPPCFVSVWPLHSDTHHSSFYPLPLHIFLPLCPFIHFIQTCYHPIPHPSVQLKSHPSVLKRQAHIPLYNLIPTVHTLSFHPSPLAFFTFPHLFSHTECHSSPIKMQYKANKTKTIQGSPIDFCMENSLLI